MSNNENYQLIFCETNKELIEDGLFFTWMPRLCNSTCDDVINAKQAIIINDTNKIQWIEYQNVNDNITKSYVFNSYIHGCCFDINDLYTKTSPKIQQNDLQVILFSNPIALKYLYKKLCVIIKNESINHRSRVDIYEIYMQLYQKFRCSFW